jgi:hypothetical protein
MATFAIDLLTGKEHIFNGDFTNSGMTTFTGITTANNGLTRVGLRQVKLGGVLTCVTTITKGVGNTAGIEYGGDYSASFTNRSLIDKRYVDLKVSGNTPSWTIIVSKPSWLSGTTLQRFQTGHTHSYNNLANKLSGGTGISISGDTINLSGLPVNVTLQLVDSSGDTEVNTIIPTPIIWTVVEFSGTTFNFTGGSRIIITENGIYGVGYMLNVENQNDATKNIGCVIRKNGNINIITTTSTSQAINLANKNSTNIMTIYKLNLLVGDYIELIAFRIGNVGSVKTIANGSWITLIKY